MIFANSCDDVGDDDDDDYDDEDDAVEDNDDDYDDDDDDNGTLHFSDEGSGSFLDRRSGRLGARRLLHVTINSMTDIQ